MENGSSHLTAIYKKRSQRKLSFERTFKWWWTNTNKYWWTKRHEILMKQIKLGDHFFEKSSSMNALIVAKRMQLSNVKLETRLVWNREWYSSAQSLYRVLKLFSLFKGKMFKRQCQTDRDKYVYTFSFSMLLCIMLVGRDVSVGWIGNWERQSQVEFARVGAFLKHIDNCKLGIFRLRIMNWVLQIKNFVSWLLQINDSKLGIADW